MEERIKNRYSQEILEEAMHRYGIAPDCIQLLDGFESFIYEFERNGNDCILRVGHSLRRTPQMILGEVDWIDCLVRGGASVSPVVHSQSGKIVERIRDRQGGEFLVSAFRKAQGKTPSPQDWTPALIKTYGTLLGRIHALSLDYYPPHLEWKRPEWDDPGMTAVEDWLPPSEEIALEQYIAILEHLKRLPRQRGSYGLIHLDAHAGNLFVDKDGVITLFDFNDCAYSWYVNDIAIVLFYAALWEEDKSTFTHHFMMHFLCGYRKQYQLDPAWLAYIPHFLKLREIELYAVIHRSFDVNNLQHPFDISYMSGRKERIEAGEPCIDYPFESLAEFLEGD
jgi:Ser/Thr protein kinase RdoA (MazF antagonist)